MSRPTPRPALFSLLPENQRAKGVVEDVRNSHLVSAHSGGGFALDVGFNIRSKSGTTLATLGRGDTDIHVSGGTIARVQCSFEIDPDTGIIMLYDRSHSQTTQVLGDFATPFEPGRCRKVVVQKNLNTNFGMGGVDQNLVMFKLIWHQDPFETMQKVIYWHHSVGNYEENPMIARTVLEDADTAPPTRAVTRIHTPGPQLQRIRYAKIPPQLGSGQYGVVHRAVDIDTGRLIAVKVLTRPKASDLVEWRILKREVEFLSLLDHPYIVPYIASHFWDKPEIIMELQEGNLSSLVTSGDLNDETIKQLAASVLHHGLQALDYLSCKDIIHRDVKPDNIMFKRRDGQYVFLLGDFGLSNRTTLAQSYVGTPFYMAPEVHHRHQQTHKIDVWSLCVTIGWMLDVGRLRKLLKTSKVIEEVHNEILSEAQNQPLSKIQEMAIYDPAKRATAAQMLIKCFSGTGLSTPKNKIPTLVGVGDPSTTTTVEVSAFSVKSRASSAPNVPQNVYKPGTKVLRAEKIIKLAPQAQAQKVRVLRSQKRQIKGPGSIAKYLTPTSTEFPGSNSNEG